MAFQTGLEGRPWYVGVVIGLVVAGGVYFAGHRLFFNQMELDLAAQEKRLSQLQIKIQEGRAASLKLPQFREELRRLQLELDKLLRILPSRRNTPELMRRIRELTEQGNFELLRFTPAAEIERDFYSEWPIAISLEGNYHNLALFFDRIGRFSRIINIHNLRITGLRKQSPDRTISANFRAVTFVYKDTEEAAP